MNKDSYRNPMRIKLSEERRTRKLCSIKQYFAEHFDETLSDFRAENCQAQDNATSFYVRGTHAAGTSDA
jgi:Uncharacterized conserved protein (DUF2164)